VTETRVSVSLGTKASAPVERLLARAAETAIGLAHSRSDETSLTVVLTDDVEISQLNRQYRGVEGPTDVLAFAAEPDFPESAENRAADFPRMEEMAGYLGDVIVSLPRAEEQARAAGHSLGYELALLVAHGTLHLLGYDHADDRDRESMWALQERAACEATLAEA